MSKHIAHTQEQMCPSCQEKLKLAEAALQSWFAWLTFQYPEAHIAWSFRDEASQNLAYESGASRLRWPQSKHNAMKDGVPCSKALDLFQLVDGKAIFDPKWYQQISDENKAKGLALEWGGEFRHLRDYDHFEVAEEGKLS